MFVKEAEAIVFPNSYSKYLCLLVDGLICVLLFVCVNIRL